MGYDKKLLDENGKNKLTKYYENNTSALGTNSSNDVAVQDEKEVINHLEDIGFMNIKTKISNSFSDIIHENWIYVLAEKPWYIYYLIDLHIIFISYIYLVYLVILI